MKSFPEKIILILLVFLLTAGCKKNYIISEKQDILFQYEYVNYAWGYQHSGFIIDNTGNILTYNNPEIWNFPQKDFTLTENQVAENIASCKQTSEKIPADELQKYKNFINNIASSQVTAEKNVAADAGSSEYICFQYSENTNTYKGSIIKKEGDFTCENLNFHSKKVVAWMKDKYSKL